MKLQLSEYRLIMEITFLENKNDQYAAHGIESEQFTSKQIFQVFQSHLFQGCRNIHVIAGREHFCWDQFHKLVSKLSPP